MVAPPALQPPRRVRVGGLESAAGQLLNGNAGYVLEQGDAERRYAVTIDGHPMPKKLCEENLRLFYDAPQFGFGVGRNFMRETTFNAVVVPYQGAGARQRLVAEQVQGDCARSLGNLRLATEFVAHQWPEEYVPGVQQSVTLMTTDLNIAYAINLMNTVDPSAGAQHADNARVVGMLMGAPAPWGGQDGPLMQLLARIVSRLQTGAPLLAAFDPHRTTPDHRSPEDAVLGPRRLAAVRAGTYCIYPCPHPSNADGLEVRYIDVEEQVPCSSHDRYLDYGRAEALGYARLAAALGQEARLRPGVLASADPQAYWAAVLRLPAFIEVLEEVASEGTASDWRELLPGHARAAEESAKHVVHSSSWRPVQEDGWDVSTDEKHAKLAMDGALHAILLMMEACAEKKGIRFEIADIYEGTELGRIIMAMNDAATRVRAVQRVNGKELSAEERQQCHNAALSANGFGDDPLGLSYDPLLECAACGKKGALELKRCGKCEGVAYCSRECQAKDWKTHRGVCSRVTQQLFQQQRELRRKHPGVEVISRVGVPGGPLPTETSVFTEASGVGSCVVMWLVEEAKKEGLASPKVGLQANDMETMAAVSSDPSLRDKLMAPPRIFNSRAEMPADTRFLVSCGPLPDLELAKASLPEALRMAATRGGAITLREQYLITLVRAPGAGFTALEWAAKKGNAEAVEWLCTDERTKALVTCGAPVGWACYTGQVAIGKRLVAHGADASATDAVLWGCLPPLHVAAQNGKLEAMKWLVDELGHDIRAKGNDGESVLDACRRPPNWRDIDDHVQCLEWAKKRLRE